MDAPGNWQLVIEQLVDQFGSDNRLETFETCRTDEERVSFVAQCDVIKQVDWIQAFFNGIHTISPSKNIDTALILKGKGTSLFQQKMYKDAANKYSEAILKTQCDCDELGILYGNRSACLYYLQLYKDCLQDIMMAKKCNFPDDKLYKLLVREINCYVHLGQNIAASQCLKQLHDHMERESIDCVASEQKKQEILRLNEKVKVCTINTKEEMTVSLPQVSHGDNKLLVQASQAIDIQYTEEQGRYLIANQDVHKGDTLIVEQPYAAVLLPENIDTHCQNCYVNLKLNFYPCRQCISVKYCSTQCEVNAWNSHHRVECPYLNLLHSIYKHQFATQKNNLTVKWPSHEDGHEGQVFSSNMLLHQTNISAVDLVLSDHNVGIAHLSLRVVIVAGLEYLKCFMQDQTTIERSQKYKGIDSSGAYCHSYQSVYDLMTHSIDMETEDLLQYTLTALLLLEILRHSGWFNVDIKENTGCVMSENRGLTDDETLIGAILLRHILQLVCNAHAITQLQCTQVTDSVVEEQSQVRIATAIYPTASLMNHSCDPSIIASFNKDTLVVRAVKDIKKGEEVFNCYGPHHKRMDWDQRQQNLQQQYFFTCHCKPCTEGEKNSRSLYSYRCAPCEGPMVTEQTDKLRCQSCDYSTRLDLTSVKNADCLFAEAVKLLQENNTQNAVSKLLECYRIRKNLLYKHNKVLSETQDCLARCFASLGNFKESAKFLQRSIETVKVIYGAESIETGNELQKLTEIFISAHMWQEAIDCVHVAIRIFTEHYSESHDTVKELSDMKAQLVEVLACQR